MEFRNLKHLPKILLIISSRHVLVGLQCIQPIGVAKTIKGMGTYVVVEEERVRSPREWFGTNVEVIVVGRERDVAAVLSHEVFLVLGVCGLNLLHPGIASHD